MSPFFPPSLPTVLSAVLAVAHAMLDAHHYAKFAESADPSMPWPQFAEPAIRPPSLIMGWNQFWPPYDLGSIPDRPQPGCDARYASVCSAQHAIWLVSRARLEVCPALSSSDGDAMAALENITSGAFATEGTTGFGLFVVLPNGTIIADALRPELVGERIDGRMASGMVDQPTLLPYIEWVTSWEGGFAPHSSTRLSRQLGSHMEATPLPSITYFEGCPTGERLGVTIGREPLEGDADCDARFNTQCALQNVNRVLGLNLINFLSASTYTEMEGQHYDITYSDVYKVGGFHTARSHLSWWGVPGPDPQRNPSPFADTYGTVVASGGGLQRLVLGGNLSLVNESLSEQVVPMLNRAAWSGGGFVLHPWPAQAGARRAESHDHGHGHGSQSQSQMQSQSPDPDQLTAAIGGLWNGTGWLLSAGLSHQPASPALGPRFQACSAHGSLSCAMVNCKRLAAHARVELLSSTGSFHSITQDSWFGASSMGMGTGMGMGMGMGMHGAEEDPHSNTWPQGFHAFVFDYNGTCVADGGTASNVGESAEALLGGSAVQARFREAADADGGWVQYTDPQGTAKLAYVLGLSKLGRLFYVAVAFTDHRAAMVAECSALYAEPCSEENAQVLAGAAVSAIIAAGSEMAFKHALHQINGRTGTFSPGLVGDFAVQVYNAQWGCLAEYADVACPRRLSSGLATSDVTLLESASAVDEGSWVRLAGQWAFALRTTFSVPGQGRTELRLASFVEAAYAQQRCNLTEEGTTTTMPMMGMSDHGHMPTTSMAMAHSGHMLRRLMASHDHGGHGASEEEVDRNSSEAGCPIGAACHEDGLCKCREGFTTKFEPNTSVLGVLQPTSMLCENIAGLDCSAGVHPCPPCPAGSFCPNGQPLPCPAAHYCPPGNIYPIACPSGTWSRSAGVGTNESCNPCEPGTYASAMSLICRPCEAGWFNDKPQQDGCLPCPASGYQPQQGSTSCLSCNDIIPGSAAASVGAASADLCLCPEGMYLSLDGVCTACPDGMVCAAGSDFRNFARGSGVRPLLEERHWSAADRPLWVFRCRSARRCPGGAPGSCASELSGPSCEQCPNAHFWNGEACESCAAVLTSPIIFPGIPIVAFFAIPILGYLQMRDELANWGSWKNTISALVFVMLNHYQTISIISSNGLEVPSEMGDTHAFWAFTNDVMLLFKTDCTGLRGTQHNMIFKAAVPVSLALAALVDCAAAAFISRWWPKVALDPNRMFNVVGAIFFAVFGAISAMSMELFKCSNNPNGERTMTTDASIICYKAGDWMSLLALGIVCVLVYVVAVAMLFFHQVLVAPTQFQYPVFRKRWGFLFIRYRAGAWWTGLVFLGKNTLVNLSIVLFPDALYQIFFTQMVVLAYTVYVLSFWPYRVFWANRLEVVSSLSVVVNSCILAAFAFQEELEDAAKVLSLYASGVTCFPIVLGGLCSIYLSYYGILARLGIHQGVLHMDKRSARLQHVMDTFVESSTFLQKLPSTSRQELMLHFGDYEFNCLCEVESILASELTMASKFRLSARQFSNVSSESCPTPQSHWKLSTEEVLAGWPATPVALPAGPPPVRDTV